MLIRYSRFAKKQILTQPPTNMYKNLLPKTEEKTLPNPTLRLCFSSSAALDVTRRAQCKFPRPRERRGGKKRDKREEEPRRRRAMCAGPKVKPRARARLQLPIHNTPPDVWRLFAQAPAPKGCTTAPHHPRANFPPPPPRGRNAYKGED